MAKKQYAVLMLFMLIASFLGGVSAVWMLGQSTVLAESKTGTFDEIVCEKFRLVDAEGKTRVFLGFIKSGLVFTLFDKSGDIRVLTRVSSDSEAAGMTVYGTGGNKSNANIVAGAEDAVFAVWDGSERERLTLGSRGDGLGLLLRDATGQTRAVVGVAQTVNKVTDAETTTAESNLTLFDGKGTVIWRAP